MHLSIYQFFLRIVEEITFVQDEGLSIKCRCVKCCECWQCRNADEMEKLSLREEQENYLIKQSVKLDHADTKSKEITLSSFQYFFDKVFIQFTSELSQEEWDLFKFKEVHYFLPWRPVFFNSVTTLCRPAFDASYRTR